MAEPIDEYFTATISAMKRIRAPTCGRRTGTGRFVVDGASVLGAVRCSARQPPPRSGRALAAVAGQGLLHHRIVRARRQRRRRGGAAAHRPGAAALPVRRLLPGPRRAGRRPRAAARCAARPGGGHGGADRGRAAQGLRPPRPAHHPADVDHRIAPAAGRRRRVLHRARQEARGALRMARRRGHGVQLRRRVGEPLHRGRRDQHRAALRVSGRADAAAVRLRGQRDRHQRQDAPRLDRADLRKPRRLGVFRRRRLRSARDVRCRGRSRRLGAHPPTTGVPASAHGPADGTCRFRLRTGLSPARGDQRRVRPGSGAADGETVDHRGGADAVGGARPLRGQAHRGHRSRRPKSATSPSSAAPRR